MGPAAGTVPGMTSTPHAHSSTSVLEPAQPAQPAPRCAKSGEYPFVAETSAWGGRTARIVYGYSLAQATRVHGHSAGRQVTVGLRPALAADLGLDPYGWCSCVRNARS